MEFISSMPMEPSGFELTGRIEPVDVSPMVKCLDEPISGITTYVLCRAEVRKKWQAPECLRGWRLVRGNDKAIAVKSPKHAMCYWVRNWDGKEGNDIELLTLIGFTTEGMPEIPPEGLELT